MTPALYFVFYMPLNVPTITTNNYQHSLAHTYIYQHSLTHCHTHTNIHAYIYICTCSPTLYHSDVIWVCVFCSFSLSFWVFCFNLSSVVVFYTLFGILTLCMYFLLPLNNKLKFTSKNVQHCTHYNTLYHKTYNKNSSLLQTQLSQILPHTHTHLQF